MLSMNQVIIKGTWKEILDLEHDHYANVLGLVFISEDHGTTIAKTYSEPDALNRWFVDCPHNAPFPIGTLLHWSPIGQVSGPLELAASRKFIDDHFEIVHVH